MKEDKALTTQRKSAVVSDMTTGSPMKLILSFALPLL
jgi:hypothetical protein